MDADPKALPDDVDALRSALLATLAELGVDEDLIHELTLGLEPEDGVIWVYGVDDGDGTLAFTDEGVEEVQLILMEYSRIRTSKP